jgi:alkyl sulfatase BDS1-like metallo-beta-lactamase superfamily hydrolase
MTDLLALSERVIETGEIDGPVNRINHELSIISDDIAIVEAFSHSIIFKTEEGLVVFDTSGPQGGARVVEAVRGWSSEPFHTIVYTHGHIDHVGGCGAFVEDAEKRAHRRPSVAGHENVSRRFDRYDLTSGYNLTINARQFRGFQRRGLAIEGAEGRFLPRSSPKPELTYRDTMTLQVGGLDFDLRHAKGETDDHTWTWIPRHRAICAGDFFIWNFPNAGNPQKVQRYPIEWANALRDMAAMNAELFIPAHGLPIAGVTRIRTVLTDVASALERLVADTLEMMNAGARLNDIVHDVKVDPTALEKPYLHPLYDEPEFVVNNIWRMYGGWYDGNPANLKPAREAEVAREFVSLAGNVEKVIARAEELAANGEHRIACHLIETAVLAEPDNRSAHAARAEIYQARRGIETSLMSKGIFGYAAGESRDKLDD